MKSRAGILVLAAVLAVMRTASLHAQTTNPPTQSAATPGDSTQELAALQARAERGDAAAQYQLAEHYFGRGDFTNATKWMRKSAEGGYADAQNSLGFRFLVGDEAYGFSEDVEEARKWFEKAAEQGHAAALIHLCNSYVEPMNLQEGAVPLGDFPPARVDSSKQDVAEALEWCAKSANDRSHYALGLLYAKGSADFEPDYENAYFWLTVRNAPAARAFREKVGQQLTPERRAEIENKAQEFKSAQRAPRAP